MRAILACFAAATAVLASEKVFNIHDDLDAFPHYKIVFDASSISPSEAQSLLSHNVTNFTPAKTDGSAFEAPAIPSEHVRLVMPPSSTHSVVVPPYAIPVVPTAVPYLCSIPRPIKPSYNESEIDAARLASLSEAERANRRGWELLEGMKDECIYHVKGWWAYEYCYGVPDSMVKQFHPITEETGKPIWPLTVDSQQAWFILGRAQPSNGEHGKAGVKKEDVTQKALGEEDAEAKTTQDENVKPGDIDLAGKKTSTSEPHFIPPGGTLVNKGDTTYLTHRLDSGTRCDLTYRHREIEIQYHCRPELQQDWIAVVKEITTCSYLMVVQTPRLCKDAAFHKKSTSDFLEIKCRKIAEHTRDELFEETPSSEQDVAPLMRTENMKAQYRDGKLVIGGTVIGGGKYFPIPANGERGLKQPENWRPSGTKQNPDGELIHDEERQAQSGKFKMDKPSVGGQHVGVAAKDGTIEKMTRIKRDHADVVYTVVASGVIGESAWEVLDEKILKAFKLGPKEVGLILQDVDWRIDGKGKEGQRWYMVVLTGPKVENGLEIRAVVETDDVAVSTDGKVAEEDADQYETRTENAEDGNSGGSEEEMIRDEL